MTESKFCSIHWFLERDIDLLLAEEFRVNAEFGRWFLERCGCDPSNYVFPAIKAKVSVVSLDTRESDVAILFKTKSNRPHRLYVEDKITAKEMPRQLKDYIKRAKAEKEQGETEGYSIALFAPYSYPHSTLPDEVVFVSFEDAAECLSSISSNDRTSYRVEFLRAAAKGSRSPKEVAPHVKKFWDAVHEMIKHEFCGYFIYKTPHPTSYYSLWTQGWPSDQVRPNLLWYDGKANLVFQKANYQRLRQCIKEIGHCPGNVRKGKDFVAIDISGFPSFNISDDLSIDDNCIRIKKAYEALKVLMDYYIDNSEIFEKAFDDA